MLHAFMVVMEASLYALSHTHTHTYTHSESTSNARTCAEGGGGNLYKAGKEIMTEI